MDSWGLRMVQISPIAYLFIQQVFLKFHLTVFTAEASIGVLMSIGVLFITNFLAKDFKGCMTGFLR